MKTTKKLLITTAVAIAASTVGIATAQDRALTQDEINELIARSNAQGANIDASNVDVNYAGAASNAAVDSVECCTEVEERIENRTDVQETTTYVDAVTEREIIQPVERTLIQPVERRVVRGRTESVTEATRFEEEFLPARVERDDVPAVTENYIPQETVETREEVTETYYDAVAQRDVIQPVVRTRVVPVQRRISRPRVETVTSEPRYETITAPVQINEQPVPSVNEYTTEQVNTTTREDYTETFVDVVTQQDVYQPVERTLVQPIERQILRGTSEDVTSPTQYVEEYLPARVIEDPRPEIVENYIPQVTERTVLEVQDVYVDQVTRQVIQPVVITTVQPIENRLINPRSEQVIAPARYEEEYLPGRVIEDPIPETVVNYIPQVTTNTREQYSETYFEAVTQRNIYQPIVRTQIQPVEYRRVRPRTETVTAPVQYENYRDTAVVIDLGTPCNCEGGYTSSGYGSW